MKILIESMTKVQCGIFTIRCWRQETKKTDIPVSRNEVRKEISRAYTFENRNKNFTRRIAERILKMKRMNAVEILVTETGAGEVLYKNWP